MRLKIFKADPKTGEMTPDAGPELTVTGRNIDACMDAARKLLAERGYPTVRSINVGEDSTLVVYCEEPPQKVEETEATKGLYFNRPDRYKVKV